MSRDSGEPKGPSWADVSELIQHIEKEHKCVIRVEMGAARSTRLGLVWDCVAQRANGRQNWYTICHVMRYWPTHQARTVPGLLVQTLWKLQEAIHDYDELPLLRPMPEADLPLPPDA